MKDSDDLTWAALLADLMLEWKRLKASDSSNTCPTLSTSSVMGEGIHKSTKRLKAQSSPTTSCSICGRSGHDADECFLNPESSSCKLPTQARDSLSAIQSEKQNSKTSRIHFGSIAKLQKKCNVQLAAKATATTTAEPPILESGASLCIFRDLQEANEQTYTSGSSDFVQLAAGQ